MASYQTLTNQVLAAGDPVIWTTTVVPGCCDIQHRDGTGTIALRGSGCCCRPAVYRVCAHVIVTAPDAAAVQLQLALDGIPIPGGLIALPAVAAGTALSGDVCCDVPVDICCSRLSLEAVTAATVATAVISVDKE